MQNINEGDDPDPEVNNTEETAVATDEPLHAEQFDIKRLPIKDLMESPTNPSHRSGRPTENFINSIREKGVLQPILVRPIIHDVFFYEIVYGHRRVAAARIVGFVDIPATIRDLTDKEVVEIQVIENVQREDIHPIEEGEGYKKLMDDFGYTVEEIEIKTGSSRSTIYERLKLCDLEKTVRKSALAGEISASVAFLISRIPNKSAHPEALKGLIEMAKNDLGFRRRGDDDDDDGIPEITYRAAAKFIKENYMLDLREAPFPVDDAELVKAAGACGACPKKTGNQSNLFGDVTNKELCTDSKCYKSKLEAYGKIFKTESEQKGYRWLPAKELKEVYKYGSHPTGNLIDLNSQNYSDAKSRTWQQIIGKLITPDLVSACINPAGKPTLLIKDSEAQKILKKGIRTGEVKGIRTFNESTQSYRSSGNTKFDKEQRHKKAVEQKLWDHLRDTVVPDLIKSQLIEDRFPEIPMPMRAALGILLSNSIYHDEVKEGKPSEYIWDMLGLPKENDKKKKRDVAAEEDIIIKAVMKAPASDLFAALVVSGCDGFVDYHGNITKQIELIFGLSDAAIKPEKVKLAAIVESDREFENKQNEKKEKQQSKNNKKASKSKGSKNTDSESDELASDDDSEVSETDTNNNSETDTRACRVCKCTHTTPCAGGCSWVEDDLCSACADSPKAAKKKGKKEPKAKDKKEPKVKIVKEPKAKTVKSPKVKTAKAPKPKAAKK